MDWHSPPFLLTRARYLTNFTSLVGHRSEQAGWLKSFHRRHQRAQGAGASGPGSHIPRQVWTLTRPARSVLYLRRLRTERARPKTHPMLLELPSSLHQRMADGARFIEPRFMYSRPSDRRGPWNSIPGPQCAFKLSMFMCPAVHT